MIDLHTHILPGIDDGAKSAEEALRMTQELHRQRVSAAVCTPHYDPSKQGLADFAEQRAQAFGRIAGAGISLIAGSETVLNEYLFHYPDLKQLCIENTEYILIELPFGRKWKPEVFDQLDRLINYYGLIPIIAHVERYRAARRKKVIKRLIEAGCLIQLNASTVLDRKSWRRASGYLKSRLIDLLASDCHNTEKRPPNLSAAYLKISAELGEQTAKLLDRNAQAVIQGIRLRDRNVYLI